MASHKASKSFDVIIVGAGPAGLFAAYYLGKHTDLDVLVIEKGKPPLKRECPVNTAWDCVKCRPCNILCGVGGAGLFSDGKLNFIHKLGKTDLTQWMPASEATALIQETEEIFNHFGMDGRVYPTDMDAAREIRKNAKRHGVDLLIIRQKHLGSDNLPNHIAEMSEAVRELGVTVHTSEDVREVLVVDGRVTGVSTNRGNYEAENVILAPGRVGAEWMGRIAQAHGLPLSQRGIEVGVRVEVHKEIMQDLCSIIYDPTFFIQTNKYDDQTRTFCTNQGGYVSLENYQDFVCVNGHAFMDKKSENTNFAFLSKVVLNDPVTDNQAYGEAIGRLATLIGGGKPILQRFGDLRRGRRSTWSRVQHSYIEPTLRTVVCGDIAMALPERILANVVEGLHKLNEVVPGVANDETLLYAPEIKFFAT
ncbi:MAG: NAD(P)/FAD-dependent oxidoreductase, partial [Desulfovibrionaceae bacterium]